MTVAHDLESLEARDVHDRPVRLGTLWRDRTAVLVFIRHFG